MTGITPNHTSASELQHSDLNRMNPGNPKTNTAILFPLFSCIHQYYNSIYGLQSSAIYVDLPWPTAASKLTVVLFAFSPAAHFGRCVCMWGGGRALLSPQAPRHNTEPLCEGVPSCVCSIVTLHLHTMPSRKRVECVLISTPDKKKKEKHDTFATMGWVDPAALEDKQYNYKRGYDVFAGRDDAVKLTDIKVQASDIYDPSAVPTVIVKQIPGNDWSDEAPRITLCIDCVDNCQLCSHSVPFVVCLSVCSYDVPTRSLGGKSHRQCM